MRFFPLLPLALLLAGCVVPSQQEPQGTAIHTDPEEPIAFESGLKIDVRFSGEILFLQRYLPTGPGMISFDARLQPDEGTDYALMSEVKRTNWQQNYTDFWFILPTGTATGQTLEARAPVLGGPKEDPALVLYALSSGPARLQVEVQVAGHSAAKTLWSPAFRGDISFEAVVRSVPTNGQLIEGEIETKPDKGAVLLFEHPLAGNAGKRVVDFGDDGAYHWHLNGTSNGGCDIEQVMQLMGTPFHTGSPLPFTVAEQRSDIAEQRLHILTWQSGVEAYLRGLGFDKMNMQLDGTEGCVR